MKIVDLTGQVFSRLTVIKLSGSSRGGSKLWECKCSCGNICYVSTRHLNRKNNINKRIKRKLVSIIKNTTRKTEKLY